MLMQVFTKCFEAARPMPFRKADTREPLCNFSWPNPFSALRSEAVLLSPVDAGYGRLIASRELL